MPQLTVLVVDDDPVIVNLLKVNFEMEGYRVVTAGDGEEAIEQVRDEHPDVIVCDVMMPKLDGFGVAAKLKGDRATRSTPLILLTAKAQMSDLDKGKALGVDDYVTKPFDPMDLIDRVNAVLARARR